jgi:hypothetical protein
MDDQILTFIKDFLWAPLLGLVAWAWKTNEDAHKALAAEQKAMRDSELALRKDTSTGHSVLNDKIMEHIDDQVREVRLFVIQEDAKLMAELGTQRGHIGKIFDKMDIASKRSEDQHIETLQAIHALANTMHQSLAQKADK